MMNFGIPSLDEYKKPNVLFNTMEKFAAAFHRAHFDELLDYSERWAFDPLHEWSRRYEYPWVYQTLTSAPVGHMLDAGSGTTFFPFFIAEMCKQDIRVSCLDGDQAQYGPFTRIVAQREVPIDFQVADLRSMPYPDETFDTIVCVSVLEHTHDYVRAVDEFMRVLKPCGRLILTFDLSLDGVSDIPPRAAVNLLHVLNERLIPTGSYECPNDLWFDVASPTRLAFRRMTVVCCHFTKPVEPEEETLCTSLSPEDSELLEVDSLPTSENEDTTLGF